MNSNTKTHLIRFINEVERLTFAVSSFVGEETVKDVFENSERLKEALEKDETILETR